MMMPIILAQLQGLIQDEYHCLTDCLGLRPVSLDIYVITETQGVTTYGTDTRNAAALYSPSSALIVLPSHQSNLDVAIATSPPFPPTGWDPSDQQIWPWWRTELWHEVVHQYQDQKLQQLDNKDGSEGHTKGWPDAIAAVATLVRATPEQVGAVL